MWEWRNSKKWKYTYSKYDWSLHPCNRQQFDRLKWNLPPPQKCWCHLWFTHEHSNPMQYIMKHICTSTHSWVFFINTSASEASSIIDIIDIDSWPNFIPLSKLCSESTISAAESRCSCFSLTLAPNKNVWHTVGYSSTLLRDIKHLYIYIHVYILIYIIHVNEVANPVNSGLHIGHTILIYLICQTTVSNGGILLPHNCEKD